MVLSIPKHYFFVIQLSETYIQNQCNGASGAYVGAHALASSGLDQSTNHHGNTDVNDNDDSQLFETPRENNCSSFCFGDKINTIATPY